MVDIERLLGKFGLTPKEIQAYLAMIKLGPATAGQIASRAGLKRPTVYIILEELRQKELLLKIPHTKKAIYQAKSPQELYNQMAEQVGELHEALPQLRSIMGENKRIRTLYFEGLKEIVFCAHFNALHHAVQVIDCRNHNNREIASLLVLLNSVQHFITA